MLRDGYSRGIPPNRIDIDIHLKDDVTFSNNDEILNSKLQSCLLVLVNKTIL